MSTRPAHDPGPQTTDVNLTPMLDVVFILLIFFIVTATFLREFGLDAHVPPGALQTDPAAQSIALTVLGNGGFSINGRAVSRPGVSPYLRQLRAELPDARFAVLVAPRSSLDDLVFALDASRRAGFAASTPITALKSPDDDP